MQAVGANPDNQYAERIVKGLKHIHADYRQDVLIIIAIESSFDAKATSSVGARGLMQLMPIAVKHVVQEQLCGITEAPKDVYNIEDNIALGSCFFQSLMVEYNYNRAHALIHYNGGSKAVRAYVKGTPYTESLNYLKKFTELENKINTKGN